MDKYIDTWTLVEQAERTVAEAATGATRFLVSGSAADVVIAKTDAPRHADATEGRKAMKALWAGAGTHDLPPMTVGEIGEEIATHRREKREAAARGP